MRNADARRCSVGLALLLAVEAVGAVEVNSTPAPLIPRSQAAVAHDSLEFHPKADNRGFIDVWQLRDDVIKVEPLQATDDTDGCYPEGDGDDQYTEKKLQEMTLAAQACESQAHEAYARYKQVFDKFNQAWLPLIKDAISKGDPVAEIVMRQCNTTPVLDRSGIESTCDQDVNRQIVARGALKRIGFIPAVDLHAEIKSKSLNLDADEQFCKQNQLATLVKIGAGALGMGYEQRYIQRLGSGSENDEIFEQTRRWLVIESVLQDAPRAFSYSPESDGVGWATSALGTLSLNRKPMTPGDLTWGREKYYGGGNEPYTGYGPWRSEDRRFLREGNSQIAGLRLKDFLRMRADLLAEAEGSIDRYLAQDPRWGVFLLHRVGFHEWVPEGMKSTTHVLGPGWDGEWVLDKAGSDWSKPLSPTTGKAVIRLDGEIHKITITAENSVSPTQNVTDCTLRLSGGSTHLPEMAPEGQKASNTMLGYFFGPGSRRSGLFIGDGANKEAVEPFDSKVRYPQVLMQCDNAENPHSDRVRFLLLASDVLVEFATEKPYGSTLSVRHYRRVKPVPGATATFFWSKGILAIGLAVGFLIVAALVVHYRRKKGTSK